MVGPVPVSGWPSRAPRPIPWGRWWAAIGISVVVFVVLVAVAILLGPPLLDGLFGVYRVTGTERVVREGLFEAGMVVAIAWWLGGSSWVMYKAVAGRTDREVLAVGSAPLATGAVLGLLGWLLTAYMGVLG